MANCPKCGQHLRLVDWKPKCPHCGANVFLYDLQERLMQDADKAEVQHFHFQKKMDRAKASYIGSKLAITRIVTSLLPVGALFLPMFSAEFGGDLGTLSGKIDAIRIYKLTEEADLGGLPGAMLGAGANGIAFAAALICLVLSLLFLLLHFALLFLSCSPHGKSRNITLDILQLVSAAACAGLLLFLPAGTFVAVGLLIGSWVYLALSALSLLVDALVYNQGIDIVHKQCYVGGIPIEEYFEMVDSGMPQAEIRAEQYRRLTAQQLEKERALAKELEKASHGKEAATDE